MTRIQYLLLSIFSFGLVVFALILQQTGYQGVSFLPCPLCILQRVGYLGIAFSCLLAAGITPLRKLFHSLAALSAAGGLLLAARQVWLLSHPESSCGVDPLETWINQFQLVQNLPWLFKADGLCSAQLPAILGLQVPEWSLLWFAVFLLVLLVTFFRKP
ncbi:disulfide bond formation protein B [Polynucleobacter sp. MWH-Creno-3A4]|uniref:disulfide bond formation protein B n=1 Tax=Polynucleobacter sp. MWH-Creno-3A4 TaxID=1855886 RepID=UPI001C0BE433|nr:disulfide bond formation protein B [Polynucleobacter sp. MWH-Creno-3A4]MBU3606287.1 disulfide bond formation protein B [Polynucleobacter sp. MWH-Creno-3A4]